MRSIRLTAILAVSVGGLTAANAGQTVSYVYDALGRLTDVQILSGPGAGVIQSYRYDAAGNRTSHQVTAPGQTTVSVTMPNTTAIVTSAGVTLTVNVGGSAPGGTVTFTENGTFLGIASVISGVASITLEGLPSGPHSITATYSGDGTYAPRATTFNVNVRDLRWLPAVLDVVLSD